MKSSNELPWQTTFHSLCRDLLEELGGSYVDSIGRGLWKLGADFLWTLPHVLLPFADFALYPFTIIKLSCEYDYMLSPMSSSCESSILKVVLGTLTHTQNQLT